MITIRQTSALRVPAIGFTHGQLGEIANTAIAAEAARVGQAINVLDQPARPLTPKYAKAKVKQGGRPVRDLRLTGAMLASRGIIETQDKSVTVGFHEQSQLAKAAANEAREKMLGPSPNDRREVSDCVRELFRDNLRAAKNRR